MNDSRKMEIFRAAAAPDLSEANVMSSGPVTAEQQAGMDRLREAGFGDGYEVKLLVNIPGFSLTYVWFKKDYPLPLHSHNADCLYFIIGGEMQLGSETLGPRDSFFLPAGAPYTYRPGPEGVELLEIRQAAHFDIQNLAKNPAFYETALATVAANRDIWKAASRPTANA